jgi:hypothetical protein
VTSPDPADEAQATELYHYFAADGPPNCGRLLYVGISLSVGVLLS